MTSLISFALPQPKHKDALLLPMVVFGDLPLDILAPILENLNDARDWGVCTLVDKAFNKAATPLLYRNLDTTRIKSNSVVRHPAATLLKRPELAQHVHHITEFGSVHRRVMQGYNNITQDALKALALCTSLRSLTWTDDSMSPSFALVPFLDVIKSLPTPIEELHIRTHNDPAEEVWQEINKISGLRKVSIWCMEGPPRVLQGWSELLGPTLTHLELGRCAGVPPTILYAVLLNLPNLQVLRVKGAPSSAITNFLSVLPNLKVLDTEYLGSGGRSRGGFAEKQAALRTLTVRTSSADYQGPRRLWTWLHDLIPGPEPSLVNFSLHAFIMNVLGKGHVSVPRSVILNLGNIHGSTINQITMGDAQLTVNDIECLCELCPNLKVLTCSTVVECGKADIIKKAISSGTNLRSLTLQVDWIPDGTPASVPPFTTEKAREWMLRSEDSSLWSIAINDTHYTGKWALEEEVTESEHEGETVSKEGAKKNRSLRFIVTTDLPKDRWYLRFGSKPGLALAL